MDPDKRNNPFVDLTVTLVFFLLIACAFVGCANAIFHGRKTMPTPDHTQPAPPKSVLDCAKDYTARGWAVIPIPFAKKGPVIPGWQKLRLTAGELPKHFSGRSNIGVALGEPSGGLVDVDLDHATAVALADLFLPNTPAVFGRATKPRSHRLFKIIGEPAVNTQFKLPGVGMIVELRSTGLQTVFPPSVHEKTGEAITWEDAQAEPMPITFAELREAVQALFEAVRETLPATTPATSPATSPAAKPTYSAPVFDQAIPMAEREKRCRAYLAKCPDAISGQDGHGKTLQAACECFRFGLDDAAISATMTWFNQTKTGGELWSDKELDHKIESARKKVAGQFGNRLENSRPRQTQRHHGQAQKPKADHAADDEDPAGSPGGPGGPAGPGETGRGLGMIDPDSGRLILSPKKTLPTADAFLKQFYSHPEGTTLVAYAGSLMAWRDNRYMPLEDAAIRTVIFPWLHSALRYSPPKGKNKSPELVPFEANPDTVSDALESVRDRSHIATATPVPSWLHSAPSPDTGDNIMNTDTRPDPRQLLPFLSGTLDLETGKIIPPTPKLFTTNALAFDYNPEAPEPVSWLTFLDQLWGDDFESIQLLQEWLGYCLLADTRQQKALLLVGPPRAGKGVIGRVTKNLVGEANVAGPTTASLAMPHGLHQLVGKSLAMISDARFTGEHIGLITERLLCIIGEDPISIDRKYQDTYTVRLPTRFVFITNEIPRLSDASSALTKRFLILRLTNTFYGREDHGLDARLEGELPGILNWAIAGLHRLRERGHFKQPESTLETVQELEDLGSPVGAFVREECILEPALRSNIDDLYAGWKKWCERDGRSMTQTKQSFGRDLAACVPTIRIRKGTGNARFYQGIDIKRDI